MSLFLEIYRTELKGDGNPDDYYFYMKDLNKPWILIPVSSKSVEKCDFTQPN